MWKQINTKLVRKTDILRHRNLRLSPCSSCVLMRPRPVWTRRRTNSCNKPSGRNFRTRPSSQLHTGKGRAARPFLIFPLLCWLFNIARVTRLNTIMDCERVLVLHAGKVVEFDTPAALCQTDGSIFQRLVGHRAEWVTLDTLWIKKHYLSLMTIIVYWWKLSWAEVTSKALQLNVFNCYWLKCHQESCWIIDFKNKFLTRDIHLSYLIRLTVTILKLMKYLNLNVNVC